MAGTLRAEIWVNGSMVAAADGAHAVSYASATVLLGEGDGASSKPPVSIRYDDASMKEAFTEKLGNRGFESAINPIGLSDSFGNWRPSNGSIGVASDIVRSGAQAGRLERGSATGASFMIQDVALGANTFVDLSCWLYRSSTAPTGRTQMSLMFDWDRGGGTTSGAAGMGIGSDGKVSWSAYDVGGSGLIGLLPLNTWTHWRILVYPSGKPAVGGWRIGIHMGDNGQGW